MIKASCRTCKHYDLKETQCIEPFSLRRGSSKKTAGPCRKFIEKQLEKETE